MLALSTTHKALSKCLAFIAHCMHHQDLSACALQSCHCEMSINMTVAAGNACGLKGHQLQPTPAPCKDMHIHDGQVLLIPRIFFRLCEAGRLGGRLCTTSAEFQLRTRAMD